MFSRSTIVLDVYLVPAEFPVKLNYSPRALFSPAQHTFILVTEHPMRYFTDKSMIRPLTFSLRNISLEIYLSNSMIYRYGV